MECISSATFKKQFEKWVSAILRSKLEIPWSLPLKQEALTAIGLHVFWDASKVASCAVVYAVGHQPTVTTQSPVISESRIYKKSQGCKLCLHIWPGTY